LRALASEKYFEKVEEIVEEVVIVYIAKLNNQKIAYVKLI